VQPILAKKRTHPLEIASDFDLKVQTLPSGCGDEICKDIHTIPPLPLLQYTQLRRSPRSAWPSRPAVTLAAAIQTPSFGAWPKKKPSFFPPSDLAIGALFEAG
jgi:hypothetical protein